MLKIDKKTKTKKQINNKISIDKPILKNKKMEAIKLYKDFMVEYNNNYSIIFNLFWTTYDGSSKYKYF